MGTPVGNLLLINNFGRFGLPQLQLKDGHVYDVGLVDYH